MVSDPDESSVIGCATTTTAAVDATVAGVTVSTNWRRLVVVFAGMPDVDDVDDLVLFR